MAPRERSRRGYLRLAEPARNSGLMRSYRNCTFPIFGSIVNPSVFLVLLNHDNSLHNFLASFNSHNGIVRESSDCIFQLLDRHFTWFLLFIVSGFVNQKSITQSRHDLDRIFGRSETMAQCNRSSQTLLADLPAARIPLLSLAKCSAESHTYGRSPARSRARLFVSATC
jgi:hypothetical protein